MDTNELLKEARKIKRVLDEARISYWIDFGTLLGAGQRGSIFEWDTDFDFSALKTEVPKIFSILPNIAELGYRIDVTDECIYFHKYNKTGEELSISMGIYTPEGENMWMIFIKDNPRLNFILKYLDRIAEKSHYRGYHYKIPLLEKLTYAVIPPFMDRFIRKLFFGICHVFGQREHAMVLPKKLVEKLTEISLNGVNFPAPTPHQEYLPLIYGDGWKYPRTDWKWEYVKAMDYEFFRSKRRWEYSLF